MNVVTIDGPAGVGKSTIAKNIAQSLAYPYLDTGSMYRTLALYIEDFESLSDELLYARCKNYNFKLLGHGTETHLLCNGILIGSEIRTEEVGARASRLAALLPVRIYLQQAQRSLGQNSSLVAEGRDMGIKVFPRAKYKFFLDAVPKVRAERRYKELQAAGVNVTLEELIQQITTRDCLDRTRELDPLMAAPEAVIVDTSDYSVLEVTELMLKIINKK